MRTTEPISFEEIRERAYDLWEWHHRPDGHELQFWFMAERELALELARKLKVFGSADSPAEGIGADNDWV